MTKVANKKVIRRLAIRELKTDRRMSFMVIVSIMLTCILFTALTSIGGGLINGMQQETMRQAGGNSMAGLKCVLPEDYEKVRKDFATRDICYRILVGKAENPELKNIYAEVNCAGDEKEAEVNFCAPTVGRLPEDYDDIAISTIMLDEMNIPHELGAAVPLKLDIDGEIYDHEFKLCGFWEGDKVSIAQICWVSRAFTDDYCPTPTESFYTQEHPKYAGYWQLDFNYANSWNIEKKTDELLTRLYGDSEIVPQAGINWAYSASSIDSESLVGGIVMLLVIFAAGYLIIYNIFHINISANIRSYGLLKTLGTTSKQIRHMVRTQAAAYSAIGIPLGISAGILLSRLLMDSIVQILNIRTAESYSISAKLLCLICLISAVFSFATVMISCQKPGKIAGSVSPIEALRYNETDLGSRRTDKKTGRITPLSVALNNMSRSRKKTAVVVLSLTLSMILVNTLFTFLKGIEQDKYIKNSIVGDIIIRHTDLTDLWDEKVKGVTPEMIADLEQTEGAEVHPVYYESGSIYPDGEPLERLKKLHEKYKNNEHQELELASAAAGHYSADIYGIDGTVASYFEPTEGSIDLEKLKTGKYAIVHTNLVDAEKDNDVEFYHAGDKITVECGKDNFHEYEVMAVGTMPYPLSTKVYSILGTQVMIDTAEYLSLTDSPGATCVMINTGDGNSEQVKEQCRAYCDSEGSSLVYVDKQTYLDEFSDFIRMLKLVGGTLSGILALIGILNFVNAVVTGILSRKRELAMMNAVGMTGRQLKSMLMWEGVHYAVLTACCSLAVGTLLSCGIIRNLEEGLFFFNYHFTILPIICCIPVLLFLSAAIPSAAFKVICHESVVERLREN